MRWTTRSTWIRIVVLLCAYLMVSGLWFGVNQAVCLEGGGKAPALAILLIVLPLLAIAIAGWDGIKEGFSLLWLFAPSSAS